MPEFQNEEVKGHLRTTVTLRPGETVALCRCFASEKFPFCDGSHRQHEGKGPVIVKVVEEEAEEE